jgi:hypothetical protein
LFHALDVLSELGHGPSGEPEEENEAYHQPPDVFDSPYPAHYNPRNPDPRYPQPALKNIQNLSKKGKKKAAAERRRQAEMAMKDGETDAPGHLLDEAPGLPAHLQEWEAMSSKEQNQAFANLTLPIQYRPHKSVVKWMKNLTPEGYTLNQIEAENIQGKLSRYGPNDESIRNFRLKQLDVLHYRLGLVLVPPSSFLFPRLIRMYYTLRTGPAEEENRGVLPSKVGTGKVTPGQLLRTRAEEMGINEGEGDVASEEGHPEEEMRGQKRMQDEDDHAWGQGAKKSRRSEGRVPRKRRVEEEAIAAEAEAASWTVDDELMADTE